MSPSNSVWFDPCWRLGPPLAGLGEPAPRNGVRLDESLPLTFQTPAGQWHYAVSVAVPPEVRAEAAVAVLVRLEVVEGTVGIGALAEDDRTFLGEATAAPGMHEVAFRVDAPASFAQVMIRNVAAGGVASRVVLHEVEVRRLEPARSPYPAGVVRRDYAAEPDPVEEGIRIFEDERTRAINHARLAHLAGLNLPLAGRSVLDAGCGTGYFADFYLGQGCAYRAVDGRAANVDALMRRLPQVTAGVADVERDRLSGLGRFDVVHCYGLLYHLESPLAALRNMAEVCSEMMVVETMVCDSARPLMLLVDESRSYNQALHGLGSRPSPTFLAMAFNRVGFPYVYGCATQPDHPDFTFDFAETLARRRGEHDLRRVFIAARRKLDVPGLIPLVV